MGDWVTKAFTKHTNPPVQIDEDVVNEEVVIYITGKNVYGDPTYAYLKLTLGNLMKLKMAMAAGEKFMPSDFGEVLAAGKGEPSPEIRAEMALSYNLVPAPEPRPAGGRVAPNPSAPSVWDENS